MLTFNDYNLKIKDKVLLENANFYFNKGVINHILGKNGVGKSQFAKDLLLNRSGLITSEISNNVTILSSFSNVPNDLNSRELLNILKKKFGTETVESLAHSLHIENISVNTLIGRLSDGQKQKLKLLSFLLEDKSIIVFDEVTNALDKQTINDIYVFLNKYVVEHPEKFIFNITHNLSDLKNLGGNYYLIEELKMINFEEREDVIKAYIEG